MMLINNLKKCLTTSCGYNIFSTYKPFQKVIEFNKYFSSSLPVGDSQNVAGTAQINFKPSRFDEHIKILNLHVEIGSAQESSKFFPVVNEQKFKNALRTTNNDVLMGVIMFSSIDKCTDDSIRYSKILKYLDIVSCERIDQLNVQNVFDFLYAFYHSIQSRIIGLKFFKLAIEKLSSDLLFINGNDLFTKDQFVQYCFYLGLAKKFIWTNERTAVLIEDIFSMKSKIGKSQGSVLERYLDDFSTTDMNIVCNSAYRMSVPIDFTDKFHTIFNKHIFKSSEEDEFALVDLVKTLRHNRKVIPKVTNLLTKSLLGNKFDQSNLASIAHIFAYFADNLLYDLKVTKKFIETGMAKIASGNESDIRAKDISTFIWCCAHLNTNKLFSPNELAVLEEVVLRKNQINEFERYPDTLIDACLFLWMLNPNSQNWIRNIFQGGFVEPSSKWGRQRTKLDSKITLLRSCITIENPSLAAETGLEDEESISEFNPAPIYLLKKQQNLNRIFKFLQKDNRTSVDIRNVKIVSPIKELNMAGISLTSRNVDGIDKNTHLEILEESTILSDGETPMGLVELKRRLLKAAGIHSVLINPCKDRNIRRIINNALDEIYYER